MTDRLTEQQLADIEARTSAYRQHAPTGFACCSAHPVADAVPVLLAEIRRLRAQLAEHERPSTEAERNALRQSFTELAAQAEQDRDFEGAAEVQRRLEDREEQWAREDATP